MKIYQLFLIFCFTSSYSQPTASVFDRLSSFNPMLNMGPSTIYRTASGKPGPHYLQNRADYAIKADFEPSKRKISGVVVITYKNNAPEKLDFLWLQLDQNKFSKQSKANLIEGLDAGRYTVDGFDGGYTLGSISLSYDGKKYEEAETYINDTNLQVLLKNSLITNESIKLKLDFTYILPANGSDRTGVYKTIDGEIFQVAQWFPRVCVFDDLEGWNVKPYLGAGEFYLEYGDIDYQITLPKSFIVAGSGDLLNAAQVLNSKQLDNLEMARSSSKTVVIYENAGKVLGKDSEKQTWAFSCKNTRDAAWAASEHFVWDAVNIKLPSGKSALAQSFYPKECKGKDAWGRSSEYTKHSIEFYSQLLYEYPYPNAINVAGVVSGMEYPGIVFCGAESKGADLFGVTDHEFGHTWFPMIVGSNERKYPWMDEGFNTYINGLSSKVYNKGEFEQNMPSSALGSLFVNQIPIVTQADVIEEKDLGLLAYFKPALGLKILAEAVVGDQRLQRALRQYIKEWAFKHPSPFDFFRSMNNSLGEDLSWYWQGYYIENKSIDQKIVKVEDASAGGVNIFLETLQKLPMPLEMEIKEKGKEPVLIKLPVEIWFHGSTFTYHYASNDEIESVKLNPRKVLPDINQMNNVWKAK